MDMPIPLYGADVRARALLVLAYLWTHVRMDRETKMPQSLFVWPSRAKMARELKVAETAVSREVRLLELAGLLAREKRDIQGKMLSGYALTLSPMSPIGHVQVTPVSCNTGVTIELPIGHKGVTPVSSKGDPRVTRTRKNLKEQERTKGTANDTAPLGELIPQAVLDGLCDGKPAAAAKVLGSKAFRKCMVRFHCELWGSNPRLFSADAKPLVKALKSLAAEGRQPSDVLRAMRGMRQDSWPLRRERNGWEYLVRQFQRWLEDDAGRVVAPSVSQQTVAY